MDIKTSIYFISTFFLIAGGIISVLPIFTELNRELKDVILKGKFQVRMGVYGFLSTALFAFMPYDKTMLIGDLIPMFVSLWLTFIFITGYIRISKHIDQNTLSRAEKILAALQIPSGFLALATGIIHIFLPNIIFL
jgi:hypothetical protein